MTENGAERERQAAAAGQPRLPFAHTVELRGHIIDSHILAQVMDVVMDYEAEFFIEQFEVGRNKFDRSYARIALHAASAEALDDLVQATTKLGAQPVAGQEADATTAPAPADGVLPDGFYCTTNMRTELRLDGRWLPVADVEMDLAIAVGASDESREMSDEAEDDCRGVQLNAPTQHRSLAAYAVPMADVRAGTEIVVGHEGVRVVPVERPRSPALLGSGSRGPQGHGFSFMSSAVSSERPKAAAIGELAEQLRRIREEGGRTLVVGGPAIVHTGAGPQLAALVREGYVNLLFAGNALAAHDIESALYGTSLGVSLHAESEGASAEHGHEHHLRAINAIRGCGSIRAAVERGRLTSGVMYECVKRDVPFVLAGSIRDDGPLPDVITDVIEAQRAMRRAIRSTGAHPSRGVQLNAPTKSSPLRLALLMGTTLHSIAVGNLLPASVLTVCVDINPAVVTKLLDRGSLQTAGLVMDAGGFLRELAQQLKLED